MGGRETNFVLSVSIVATQCAFSSMLPWGCALFEGPTISASWAKTKEGGRTKENGIPLDFISSSIRKREEEQCLQFPVLLFFVEALE